MGKGKKLMAGIMAAALVITAVPDAGRTQAKAAASKYLAVGETVTFDFGDEAGTADGCIGVGADHAYYTDGGTEKNVNAENGYAYGFLGIGENGYLVSERTDGLSMQPGMEIMLQNGGSVDSTDAAETDYVYADQTIYTASKADKEKDYNMGDATMPVRFALNVERSSYYDVKVTLANASSTENAVANLYSEKRHQIATNVVLLPGQTATYSFKAAVMDVYYEKSTPKGIYQDDQLNIVVTGTNAAIAKAEITRIEHQPTIFICSDSTGCDQSGYLPVYPLQNYTGVGQGITKYLQDIMLSNQGEGGLASGDNLHFNSAKAQIKAGDYLYVEYGHNEKTTGIEGFSKNLEKYYTAAHEAGAYLLLVGPIDRSQKTQYASDSNTWSSTLSAFSDTARNYTLCLIYAGLDAAKAYAAALNESTESAAAYLETIKAGGITDKGVTDVAFIDLNAGWLDFMASVTTGNNSIGTNKWELINYYFTYNHKNAHDLTHINDYGADNAGAVFAEEIVKLYEKGSTADTSTAEGKYYNIQAKVIENIYNDHMLNRKDVTPLTVPDATVLAGNAPNVCYPADFPAEVFYDFPTAVTDVRISDGKFVSATVLLQEDIKCYGKVKLEIYDSDEKLIGNIWTKEWLDNTSMKQGSENELAFEEAGFELPETGYYKAIVYPVSDEDQTYNGSDEAMSEVLHNSYSMDGNSYSWNFSSAGQVGTAEGTKDMPVVTAPAVYDSEKHAVKMTGTDSSGGKLVLEFSEPFTANKKADITAAAQISYGKLQNRSMDFNVYDKNGTVLAGLSLSCYMGTGNVTVGEFKESVASNAAYGVDASKTTDNEYTSFTVILNGEDQTITMKISSAVGSWEHTAALSSQQSLNLAKMEFTTNYANSGRSCYVDNLSVTRTVRGDAADDEDTEQPGVSESTESSEQPGVSESTESSEQPDVSESTENSGKPDGDKNSEKPGEGQGSEKPGGGQNSEKPGVSESSEKPGGGQSSEKPGGNQDSEKPGGGQDSEKPGGGQDSERQGAQEVGAKFADGKNTYRVTKSGSAPTVEFIGTKSTAKSIKIPDNVKDKNNIVYKVTSVGKNALKSNKKATSITVGKNVKTIGANAFAGCTKLTKVTVNSKVLTSIGKSAFSGDKKLGTIIIKSSKLTKVGSSALKNTKSNIKIKVPKNRVNPYTKLFKNKGQKNYKVTK